MQPCLNPYESCLVFNVQTQLLVTLDLSQQCKVNRCALCFIFIHSYVIDSFYWRLVSLLH
jgi:hypothetical protein